MQLCTLLLHPSIFMRSVPTGIMPPWIVPHPQCRHSIFSFASYLKVFHTSMAAQSFNLWQCERRWLEELSRKIIRKAIKIKESGYFVPNKKHKYAGKQFSSPSQVTSSFSKVGNLDPPFFGTLGAQGFAAWIVSNWVIYFFKMGIRENSLLTIPLLSPKTGNPQDPHQQSSS